MKTERDTQRITRRDFIKMSSLTAGLILTGCKPEQESSGGDFPVLEVVYPELKDEIVYDYGNFDTPHSARNYYNFTKSQFNPDIATEYAKDMEVMAQAQLRFEFILDSDGIERDVKFIPRNIAYHYLFIVPEDTEYPYYFAPYVSEGERFAATSLPDELDDTAITIISLAEDKDTLSLFNNLLEDVNLYLGVEMCQSSMKATVNGDYDHAMQEIGCNSLGMAYTARQLNIDYQDYEMFRGSVDTISLIRFNKQTYTSFPYRGLPISP